jgi:hypothetical protein
MSYRAIKGEDLVVNLQPSQQELCHVPR